MTLCPKESGEYIASRSIHVKIIKSQIEQLGNMLAEEMKSGNLDASNLRKTGVHPSPNDPWALDWLLLVNTLNFTFLHFNRKPGWRVEGNGGYFALCVALNRAIKNKPEFLTPKYYSTIKKEDLGMILQSDNNVEIPLLSERVKCLHEVGSALLQKYDGSFEKLVKEANGSAATLLNLIVENFRCFRDEATYEGQRVSLYKRAQILVADIWTCFENKGMGHFTDIDKITMFADYRVPQALFYFGVLEYSQELLRKLRADEILQNGDPEEVEIRGCSIHAVELLKDYVASKVPDKVINSVLIDHFLWEFRIKRVTNKKAPFHKTRSIYY